MILFIAILVGIVGGYFTSVTGLNPQLSLVSAFFMVSFALPSYLALIRQIGLQSGLTIIISLSLFAIAIEAVGVATGLPYGRFIYGDSIGWKLFGLVPWTVPFAWVPLVLASMNLANRLTNNRWLLIPLSALVLVAIDLVLDPGAFALRMWIWLPPGDFYGVPWSNFVGWFISGSLGSLLYLSIKPKKFVKTSTTMIASSAVLTLSFWSTVAMMKSLAIPFVLGWLLLAVFLLSSVHKKS